MSLRFVTCCTSDSEAPLLRPGPLACVAHLAPLAQSFHHLTAQRGTLAPRPAARRVHTWRSLAAARACLLLCCTLLAARTLVHTTASLARVVGRAAWKSSTRGVSAPSSRGHVTTTGAMGAPDMPLLTVRTSQRTFPTGDPSFAVMQAFPAGLNERERCALRECCSTRSR